MEPILARWLIQMRLEDGRLPHGQATNLIEGPGDGQSWCNGCTMLLTKAEQVVTWLVPDQWRQVRLHVDCFLIWDAERQTSEA